MQAHNRNFLKKSKAIAIVILAISQSACSSENINQRIIIASAGKIRSIDPAQANTFQALQVISGIGDTLYDLDPNGLLTPRLASDQPEIKDNGLTISIPLREGVFFHDGTIFNSKAMAFTLERFIEIGSLNYILGGKIRKIETPNPYLIELKLYKPSSSITKILTSKNLTPLSPTAYSKHKDRFLNNKFIGTGPYKLKSFLPQHQRLEKFQKYWDIGAKNKGIDIVYLSNSTSLFSAIISGEVDVLLSSSIDENQKSFLRNQTKKGLLNEGMGNALEIGYITLKSNSEPLRNKTVRQAINHSLNRELITKRVTYGLREPLLSLVPPYLRQETIGPWPTYSPDRARYLFKQSGYCLNKKLVLP